MLPDTAKISEAGRLLVGGCDTVELARQFGTPLYVFDEATIRRRCRDYKKSFSGGEIPGEVIYAGKAFMSLALCRIIADEGLSIDVSSGGELYVALAAGFPRERIFMHGNNKAPDELQMALDHSIGYIVVDSFDELMLLDEKARASGKVQKILLRLTPGIKPRTHEYIQTGQVDSKFGFGVRDGLAQKAIQGALDSQNLKLAGFHVHIGSQIFAVEPFAKSVEILLDFLGEACSSDGFIPEILDFGGGLGIKYKEDDQPASIVDYAKAITKAVVAGSARTGFSASRIAVEPGRSIVGSAGVTLYRVGTIKEIPDVRTYVAVDGGMSDNLRPMMYGAEYTALVANKANAERTDLVTVAGKHCESGDILIKDIKLPKLETGDIICTPATGAYGYAMANNFNMQPKPAVVMVNEGEARTIIERETHEDLIRKHHF